ncbi:hypothetical protein AZI86_11190 [Bdellovibrio bacteriovorus]|uniref:Uncharacterized protein n=1 Tax=Bdellovibrio bacteriovorus TaxID=959 RepID=A0A150WM32_BDEBC|nr:hypothetical protein [Bdellovibrio bacteriovorus]KYG64763.1 hypothetical protein AZI86_11190 [Bdellovibrio bacteriovorus]
MEQQKIPIQANVSDDRRSEGYVNVVYFNPAARMKEALKKLALFWGIAIVSVALPVVHFVTVPLFFCLGIFFAYRTYKSEGRVIEGLTRCPHCENEVPIKPAELQWPLTEICQNCARVVRIERK